jgi:AAA+ ATPase superfamily predicted ATPase
MSHLDKLFKASDKDEITSDTPIIRNTKACQMLIIGPKRSGKSSLILSLLSHKQLLHGAYHNIFMISPSSSDGKMKGLIDELDRDGKYYKELNTANIEAVLAYIKNEMNAKKAKEKKEGKKLPEIYNLLILDDCCSDLPRSYKKSPILSLFLNARHYNLSTMVVSQTYRGIPAAIRKQSDLIYWFPSVRKEREALQEEFDIPDWVFQSCFDSESDHPFLVVNSVSKHHLSFFRKMTPLINSLESKI